MNVVPNAVHIKNSPNSKRLKRARYRDVKKRKKKTFRIKIETATPDSNVTKVILPSTGSPVYDTKKQTMYGNDAVMYPVEDTHNLISLKAQAQYRKLEAELVSK